MKSPPSVETHQRILFAIEEWDIIEGHPLMYDQIVDLTNYIADRLADD